NRPCGWSTGDAELRRSTRAGGSVDLEIKRPTRPPRELGRSASQAMNAEVYFVAYDILRDGIGVIPVAVCLGMLLGFGAGIGLLVAERKQRKPVVGLV